MLPNRGARPAWPWNALVAKTDANPPMMPFIDDYRLVEVDADYLSKAVKPKQFIHIDQTECIACEGCVDICPWKCIHMVSVDAVDEAVGTEQPGTDPSDADSDDGGAFSAASGGEVRVTEVRKGTGPSNMAYIYP